MLPLKRHGEKIRVDESGCWIWTGGMYSTGYGAAYLNGKQHNAHRAIWLMCYGEIEEGLVLDHLCERKQCVNPEHMEPVTNQVNLMRAATSAARLNSKKTHCPQGHSLADPVFNGAGHRSCRTCHNERRKKNRRLRKLGL